MLRGQCVIRVSLKAGNLLTVKIRSETIHSKVTAPSFGGGSPRTATITGQDPSGLFLSHAVSDPGSGVSEAAAGNSAAEENPGGEVGGFLHIAPSAHGCPGPSAWLRDTLSSLPTLGAGFPKGWEDFYGLGNQVGDGYRGRGITHLPGQLSPVTGDGLQGRREKPMKHKGSWGFGSPELLRGPGGDGNRFGLGTPV